MDDDVASLEGPVELGAFNRSMQHHLKDLPFEDGVYDGRETVETFSHTEN